MCSYTSILYIYTYIHQYFMHIYLHKYTHTSHSSHVNTLTSRSPHLHQDIHVCIHGGAHGQLPAHTICMYNAFSQTHTYILLSIRMCLSIYIYEKNWKLYSTIPWQTDTNWTSNCIVNSKLHEVLNNSNKALICQLCHQRWLAYRVPATTDTTCRSRVTSPTPLVTVHGKKMSTSRVVNQVEKAWRELSVQCAFPY
jgi:hypothetical protein